MARQLLEHPRLGTRQARTRAAAAARCAKRQVFKPQQCLYYTQNADDPTMGACGGQGLHTEARDAVLEWRGMYLILGNETASALAKAEALRAVLQGTAAEQIAWVDATFCQLQRKLVEANLQAAEFSPLILIRCKKGLQHVRVKQ